ncbi:MAG: hypothetical protein KDN22_00410 [Verrucomicrobiae bacterium]|nr:hypothetical protein [Verrucomicrobiae bacterium]
MKAFALVGSLIAMIIAVIHMTKSVESVTPEPATDESIANLPALATDAAADVNANVQALEEAMREANRQIVPK